jgi:hypothetical protein
VVREALPAASAIETATGTVGVWTPPGPAARQAHDQGDHRMATYLDIHDIPGVKVADVVGAHAADVRVLEAHTLYEVTQGA